MLMRNSLLERGFVMLFVLVALLVMAIAALAIARSIDTTTLIVGNIAFRRSATLSADAGVEAAIESLLQMQARNAAIDPQTNANHPFNNTDLLANPGYYASIIPAIDLASDTTWDSPNSSVTVGTDGSGNKVRYIVERMCRNAGVPIQAPPNTPPNLMPMLAANCLFGDATDTGSEMGVVKSPATGLPETAASPQMRITVRSDGPRGTVSLIQVFAN